MTTTTTATVQELVDRALASTTADDCIVIARHHTRANLRWANNTLTTNGSMRGIDVTVISFVRQAGGPCRRPRCPGVSAPLEQVADLVSRRPTPLPEPPTPRPTPRSSCPVRRPPTGTSAPGETDIHVFDTFAPALGEAFGRARAGGRVLYGFVDHGITTTYVASTHRPAPASRPADRVTTAAPARPADLTNSAWVGGATRDFVGVDALAVEADARAAARLGCAAGRPARRSATTRSCRRPPSPT